MISLIEQEIKDYEKLIKMGDYPKPAVRICRKCKEPAENFRLHDQKKRIFLVIVGELVKKIVTILLRYKCPNCAKTFMHYPDFALPYKRYVKKNILELSEKYISKSDESYEKCTRHGDYQIEYEESESDGHSQCFEKSTLHRWISFLGGLAKSLDEVQKLLIKKSLNGLIFKELAEVEIFADKYRSEKRKATLKICQKILMVEREFKATFLISIFPQFATGDWRSMS